MSTAVKSTDHALAPINKALAADDKVRLLREMLRVRRFEQMALKQYSAGKMGGFLHLYIGQESVAVGTCSLMGDDDHVITAYRDHGHALAVGMSSPWLCHKARPCTRSCPCPRPARARGSGRR